jgi:hypothetical protein
MSQPARSDADAHSKLEIKVEAPKKRAFKPSRSWDWAAWIPQAQLALQLCTGVFLIALCTFISPIRWAGEGERRCCLLRAPPPHNEHACRWDDHHFSAMSPSGGGEPAPHPVHHGCVIQVHTAA